MRYQNIQKAKAAQHARRRARVRATIRGSAEAPRLVASRSLKHLRAQLVDDVAGRTLAAASDLEAAAMKKLDVGDRKGKIAEAYAVGLLIAERAKAKKIQTVVFDRAGRKFHGRVAALAEGARAGGLRF